MRNVLTRMAVAAAGTLVLLTVALTGTTPAHAAAKYPTAPTARTASVVVKGVTASFTAVVSVPGIVGGRHHALVLQPQGDRLIQVGQGSSRSSTVRVPVRLATRYLTAGVRNELVVEDRSTGEWATLPFTVRRQSRVRFEAQSMTHGEELTPGRVRVSALVRHWTPAGWKASNRSPVRWQVRTAAGWKTVGADRTNVYGLTGATLALKPGLRQLRAVRLTGATVTRAVSAVQWVVVP